MAKVLFFFTSSYPFGTAETFIENEIKYLSEAFDKIVIVSNEMTQEQTRIVPDNIHLEQKPYDLNKKDKLLSFINFFNPLFWKEIYIIQNTYRKRITIPIVNTILQSLQKSRLWKPYITNIVKRNCQSTDSIYMYSYWNNDMSLILATYKTANKNIKVFSRMHGWDVYFEANDINYLPFRSFIFKRLDHVFSISEKGKMYYLNLFPKKVLPITVAKLGVPKQDLKMGPNNTCFTILSISNMIPIKNLARLVEGISLLKFDFKWIHIGDGNIRNEIEFLATRLIPGKFDFKGQLFHEQVQEFLKTQPIDLFINVSKSEGIPVSIMEVFSFGIPCIATKVGGTPEIINEQNGILLSENPTSDEISQCIEVFYQLSKKEKEEKRMEAYKTWENDYNAEKNYNLFVESILSL